MALSEEPIEYWKTSLTAVTLWTNGVNRGRPVRTDGRKEHGRYVNRGRRRDC